MKLTVHEFVTLDGVVQGPGGAEEDRSGGFDAGGWLVPFGDEVFGRIVEGWFAQGTELLLGRNTYDAMYGYWSQVTDPDNAVAVALNGRPKHLVTSRAPETPWQHTEVVQGDLVEAVRALKQRPGGELQVHGCWQLVRALHEAGLVDEYRLLVFPVVLGQGKKLFPEGGTPATFEVVETEFTTVGASYQVLRPAARPAGVFAVEDGREVSRPAD